MFVRAITRVHEIWKLELSIIWHQASQNDLGFWAFKFAYKMPDMSLLFGACIPQGFRACFAAYPSLSSFFLLEVLPCHHTGRSTNVCVQATRRFYCGLFDAHCLEVFAVGWTAKIIFSPSWQWVNHRCTIDKRTQQQCSYAKPQSFDQ